MCNFGRGHYNEHLLILNLGQWFSKMSFNNISMFSSGGCVCNFGNCHEGHWFRCPLNIFLFLVQWSGTICAILVESIMGNIQVNYFKLGRRPITKAHLEPSAQVS